MKVLQLDCEMQLMGSDALNRQHVTECYVRPIITSGRVLPVIGRVMVEFYS